MGATATAAPSKAEQDRLNGVIDAMRSIQSESDRWQLAERLYVLVPKGLAGFEQVLDAARHEGVAGNLTPSTLRQYRDTAARWPADQRVAKVSFSAHREAQPLISADGRTDRAQEALNDLAKNLGPDKVTVASVRRSVANMQGKPSKSSTKPSAQQAAAAKQQQPAMDVLADLANGGPKLRSAIDGNVPLQQLDQYHAGINRVLAHVEQLRTKAAARAKRASTPTANNGASKPAAAKPAAKKQTAAGAKKKGDLRNL